MPTTSTTIDAIRNDLGLNEISRIFALRLDDEMFEAIGWKLLGGKASKAEKVWRGYEEIKLSGPYFSEKED